VTIPARPAATNSKADVWKPFWAAQQRFFKLLCVSLKVGTVVKEARAALDAGYAGGEGPGQGSGTVCRVYVW